MIFNEYSLLTETDLFEEPTKMFISLNDVIECFGVNSTEYKFFLNKGNRFSFRVIKKNREMSASESLDIALNFDSGFCDFSSTLNEDDKFLNEMFNWCSANNRCYYVMDNRRFVTPINLFDDSEDFEMPDMHSGMFEEDE